MQLLGRFLSTTRVASALFKHHQPPQLLRILSTANWTFLGESFSSHPHSKFIAMGGASSMIEDELKKPLDGSDIPNNDTLAAGREVARLRGVLVNALADLATQVSEGTGVAPKLQDSSADGPSVTADADISDGTGGNKKQQDSAADGPCALRIFAVNDVYELDKLANMKTCVDQMRTPNSIVLLAGDFLAPSLLSSLDKGRGMVDVMNAVGFTHVCFGNHECDVPHTELVSRIKESDFLWVSTNMQKLKEKLPATDRLPTDARVSVCGGGQTRSVGLLGLNTDDPGLYRPDAWGGLGASCIESIEPCARAARARLLNDGCDLVVPMTHQVMPLDRALAEKRLGFPLVLGGHDHQLYHEEVAGATILKLGADADTIGVVDVTWNDAATPGKDATIAVQKLPASAFAPDPAVLELIARHKSVLKALDDATLFTIPKGIVLTSQMIRLKQVTVGTILVSALRSALGADCAMINAGNIRGNTQYPAHTSKFTYSDLKAEVPFDSVVVCIRLPVQGRRLRTRLNRGAQILLVAPTKTFRIVV